MENVYMEGEKTNRVMGGKRCKVIRTKEEPRGDREVEGQKHSAKGQRSGYK